MRTVTGVRFLKKDSVSHNHGACLQDTIEASLAIIIMPIVFDGPDGVFAAAFRTGAERFEASHQGEAYDIAGRVAQEELHIILSGGGLKDTRNIAVSVASDQRSTRVSDGRLKVTHQSTEIPKLSLSEQMTQSVFQALERIRSQPD
jgi:hypothetical protein